MGLFSRKLKGFTISEGDYNLFQTSQDWEYLQKYSEIDNDSNYEILQACISEYLGTTYYITYKRITNKG